MRALQTIVTFLAVLLVFALVAALATGGALRDPGADTLRLIVWSGILLVSGLAAWWRWRSLGRSPVPERSEPPAEAAVQAPDVLSEAESSPTADRLSRIAERGRVAAAAAPPPAPAPIDIVPPPGFADAPVQVSTPEPEPFDAAPDFEAAPPSAEEAPPLAPSADVAPPPADDRPRIFPGEAPAPPEPVEAEPPLELDQQLGIPTRPARRTSSLGLSPMGSGGEDEEGEEEEGPVFGEEDDEEDAKFGSDAEDEEEEEEEEEESQDREAEGAAAGDQAAPGAVELSASTDGGRTAVLFRQIFPPRHDGALSFFGGMPVASPVFEWPRGQDGVPLSFLMQVDCAEVPSHARMGMPGRGQLYVFLDLTWGQQDAFRVIHEAPAGELAEIAPPEDLPAAFGEEAKHVWKWPRETAHLPTLLPKWPFQPVAVELPADAWGGLDPEEAEEAGLLWPGGERVGALLAEAQGEEIGPDWFTIKDFAGEGGSLIRPFGNFPHDARAIQVMSGLLLNRLDGPMRGQVRVPGELAASDEDRAALLDRIAAEAREWYDDASLEAPFIEVPQEFSDQYWQWLEGFPWLARFEMVEGVTMSIEASLAAGPEAAARIPAEVARRIRHRHALAVHTETGLHANTPDRMLAPPVDVQGNQIERAKTQLLLLEISSNEGLGHHFGEGVCQFWISPEDLAAGRFDAVELTADAY